MNQLSRNQSMEGKKIVDKRYTDLLVRKCASNFLGGQSFIQIHCKSSSRPLLFDDFDDPTQLYDEVYVTNVMMKRVQSE